MKGMQKKTFGDNRYVYYFDCDDDILGVDISPYSSNYSQ